MARLIRVESLLRFRESEPESRAEQQDNDLESESRSSTQGTLSPFERIKSAAGDFFIAPEVMRTRHAVN